MKHNKMSLAMSKELIRIANEQKSKDKEASLTSQKVKTPQPKK